MILIGLGANLPSEYGTPAETLEVAKKALNDHGVSIVKASPTYLSAPVPVSDAPWYANAVVVVETELTSRVLLTSLNSIEAEFGRIRTYRNAPRILDLDIVAFNEEVIGNEGSHLCLPHPRMHDRAFVLKPLMDIVPTWRHPVLKLSVSELVEMGIQIQAGVFDQTIPLEKGEAYRVAG